MPPSLVDWVSEDHLVWTVLGAVDQMDLSAFYGAYRSNGQGRAAYDPAMMVALLIYAYSRGNRSSRGIERECREDVVYKLITALQVPDHSTVAEFRRRHETELAGVFTQVLDLCREAGLVSVGVIAVDGTKITASASNDSDRDYEQIVREILEEAERLDARRTSCTGLLAAMSCPSICRPLRDASARCATPSNGSSAIGTRMTTTTRRPSGPTMTISPATGRVVSSSWSLTAK